MLASILDAASNVGYPLLFLLVAAESAGVPLPGETSLITGAVLASTGRLNIVAVIAVAAAAAIIGDNIGYVIGRKGGRYLLERPGWWQEERRNALDSGEKFFARHGPKAVFLGRWVLGLRTWTSWLAGASHLPWKTFAFWNAAGGIAWATTIGLLGYFLGNKVKSAIEQFGIWALVAFAVIIVAFLVVRRVRKRRKQKAERAEEGLCAPATADAPTTADGTPATDAGAGADAEQPAAR